MGQTIIACAKADPAVVSHRREIDAGRRLRRGGRAAAMPSLISRHHSVAEAVAAACVAQKKTLVIGTTGHTDEQVDGASSKRRTQSRSSSLRISAWA